MTKALNLGSNVHKFLGFINIDLDEKHNPDLVADCCHLDKHFEPNSVDFIHAGHFLEHVPYGDAIRIIKQCHSILKPFGSLLITVPDYTKCEGLSIEEAERVILGSGEHVCLYHIGRLKQIMDAGGFRLWAEVPLENVPYLIYANNRNPVPDKWQTSVVAVKHIPPQPY